MWQDYTFIIVILSCTILAAMSSIMGLVVVLQRESLLGDALSHAALPGVVIAFLLIQQKITPILLLGAFISGIIAVFIIHLIKDYTRLPFDGILATVLSSFFGLGMVLLTYSQKMPNAAQAGLKNFIFGQASAILRTDAIFIIVSSIIIFIVFMLFWKEIKIYIFDPLFARTSGLNISIIKFIIFALITAVIIIELQTVGIILTSAMLIAPGVAALQWTKNYGSAVALSMFFGIISAIVGTVFSTLFSNVPTGPSIVVCITLCALLSIYLGKYGVIQERIKQQKLIIKK